MADALRYAIGDLADLGGVSRRTVRYYVQEGLLPAPLGVGRGNHYGPEHLEQLLRIKTMQEAGKTLEEIRAALNGRPAQRAAAPVLRLERSTWRRIALGPGVELHVAGSIPSPSEEGWRDLAAWYRRHFPEQG